MMFGLFSKKEKEREPLDVKRRFEASYKELLEHVDGLSRQASRYERENLGMKAFLRRHHPEIFARLVSVRICTPLPSLPGHFGEETVVISREPVRDSPVVIDVPVSWREVRPVTGLLKVLQKETEDALRRLRPDGPNYRLLVNAGHSNSGTTGAVADVVVARKLSRIEPTQVARSCPPLQSCSSLFLFVCHFDVQANDDRSDLQEVCMHSGLKDAYGDKCLQIADIACTDDGIGETTLASWSPANTAAVQSFAGWILARCPPLSQ